MFDPTMKGIIAGYKTGEIEELKNPEQVRHFVITLSILIAAGSIFEYRLI